MIPLFVPVERAAQRTRFIRLRRGKTALARRRAGPARSERPIRSDLVGRDILRETVRVLEAVRGFARPQIVDVVGVIEPHTSRDAIEMGKPAHAERYDVIRTRAIAA